jgi:hypothetical protein
MPLRMAKGIERAAALQREDQQLELRMIRPVLAA